MQLNVLNNTAVVEYNGIIEEDVKRFPTIKSAKEIVYNISKPSKMPGDSYGLPSSSCKTGSKLKSVEGSICFGCYAADNWEWAKQTGRYTNYAFANVKKANQERLKAISDKLWVPAMVSIIRKRKNTFFRWHDTGDIQSIEHLENIAKVCRATPEIKHWMPSREYDMIRKWRTQYNQPSNLCIRSSAHMIDKFAPKDMGPSSMVFKETEPSTVFECEAYKRDAECGDCRACWDKEVSVVAYKYH